jgi:hypothetical protein
MPHFGPYYYHKSLFVITIPSKYFVILIQANTKYFFYLNLRSNYSKDLSNAKPIVGNMFSCFSQHCNGHLMSLST